MAAFFCEGAEGEVLGAVTSAEEVVEWKRHAGIGEVNGFVMALLTTDSKAKVSALKDGAKYEAVFDSSALAAAGMVPSFEFSDNLATLRDALKGEYAEAKVESSGSGVTLSVSETMGRRTLKYSFELPRVALDETGELRLELAIVSAQLTDARQLLGEVMLELDSVKADSDAIIGELKTQLKVTTQQLATAKADSDVIIQELRSQLMGSRISAVLRSAVETTPKTAIRSVVDSRAVFDSDILSCDEFAALKKRAFEKRGVDLGSCKLLFRGSRHGFSAKKFHELCVDKGATLTLVLTEFGHAIGGFTNVPWNSTADGSYKQDTGAWLFVARAQRSKKQFSGVRLPAILKANTSSKRQVYCHPSYGPTFGGGHNLHVANNCDENTYSYCRTFHSFTDVCDGVTLNTLAITGGTTLGWGGKSSFRVVDYEVFSVQ